MSLYYTPQNLLLQVVQKGVLRLSHLFKVSDFSDSTAALNKWFSFYLDSKKNSLILAHNAYGRILMDEDLQILSENRFLAAMQLIEGYCSAFYDVKSEELRCSIFQILG